MNRNCIRRVLAGVALVAGVAQGQAPAGYYDTVDGSSAGALRASLHDIIDDHTKIPYTDSVLLDTWQVLGEAQENPNNATQILDIYRNSSFIKFTGGNPFYNREHSWPSSYGFPVDGPDNYPYSDCHVLFLCDDGYNTSRSNKPFRNCSQFCQEFTTDVNDGQGGGSGVYPGNSNWTTGSFSSGTWEVWSGRRGDIARAIFYMDVRYEGGAHGITGFPEPNLIVTDNSSLITTTGGSNASVAYMGIRSVLLEWHEQDPVDDFERNRNDVVFNAQGNRNPFVDHPEWVDCIFGGNCCTTGLPDAPNLCSDVNSLSMSSGGVQTMTLFPGVAFGGDFYWMLGSVSGTSPGIDIAGVNVPLNFDPYTSLTLSMPLLPGVFMGFLNVFDPEGLATASFSVGPGQDPGLAGTILYHAYVTTEDFVVVDFASDPVPLLLVP